MGLFDWLGNRGRQPGAPAAWQARRENGDLVVEDGRGARYRVPLARARSVRVVPLMGGQHHATARGGWQVALASPEGDTLIGKPLADWREGRSLAQAVCDSTQLPLDELTEKMFSRVGQFRVRDA